MKAKKLFLSVCLICTSLAVFAAFPIKDGQPTAEKATTIVVKNNEPNTTNGSTITNENTTKTSVEKVTTNSELPAPPPGGGKSQLVALLLCIFLGTIGIHRFYLGYTWQGVVQLLTLGGCGIWSLIDLIRIITGDLQPKNGSYSKTL